MLYRRFCFLGVLIAVGAASAVIGAIADAPSRFSFPRSFSPVEGHVAAPEQPYRAEMCLNGSWRFQPVPLPPSFRQDAGAPPELPPPADDGWSATKIKIPSPWNVNAFNVGAGGDFRAYPSYPKAWDNAQMAWLERTFVAPAAWKSKRLLLRFDTIAGQAVVLVNGRKVGENFDLYLPAEFDVTDAIRPGTTNRLLVGVRKASLFNSGGRTGARPYPGGSMWAQAIAGIWQDVSITAVPAVHVVDTYVNPQVSKEVLSGEVTLRNDGNIAQTVSVSAQASPWMNLAGKSVLDAPEPRWKLGAPALNIAGQTVTIPAGESVTITLRQSVGKTLRTWTPETPNLYGLVVSVKRGQDVLDRQYTRFGWREFTFRGNRQLLNGKPLELRGDSWHFMGIPQMTRRYAWAWFKTLKESHGNAVRLHAQPYPSFYLDVADEMGVCVLDETAIWGSDAGHKYDSPDFWQRCDDHVRRLVLRDRNHASVFGWSVSNEVAWYIDGKHPDLMARLKQGWQDWLNTARTLDPSRPWVSTDGDNDAYGIMPTSVSHYAGPKDIVRADKPYGEGETGGAYYATPKQAAQLVGPRAYESQEGRMEGIAIEAYNLIKEQREVGACYASVFNLVWYGLQPLELGQTDTTRPYNLQDGIFFSKYREGVFGVQPERLGPYTTTLNPGYDPRLPMSRPWPLADAIKAAYGPGKAAPSQWAHAPAFSSAPANITPHIGKIVVLADEKSALPLEMQQLGAEVADAGALDSADLIVIDGNAPPANREDLKGRISRRVQSGATCLVIGAEGAASGALNELLPAPVELTDRRATSLLIKSLDPLVAGMTDADFYFTETVSGPVIRHGLTGTFVKDGTTILEACPTDWRQWNGNAEPIKTAATLRSEREKKPAGAALVAFKAGSGRYLVTTVDLSTPSMDILQVMTRLLKNAGVRFREREADASAALDRFGRVAQVLVCGSFGGSSAEELYGIDHVDIAGAPAPKAGSKSAGLEWKAIKTNQDGLFDFKKAGLSGPMDNAAVYLNFWVWSPRPLDNLLVEPNMPKLDLMMGSDDGCQVWLNGKQIKEDRGTHPVTPDAIVAAAVPLQRGWNRFVVKVVQGGGEWGYVARFRCSDARFLLGLRSSIEPPAEQSGHRPAAGGRSYCALPSPSPKGANQI